MVSGMIDAMFASALACITTACILAYLFGRHHGLVIGLKCFGPILPRHDEAPGDQFPCVFHSRENDQ